MLSSAAPISLSGAKKAPAHISMHRNTEFPMNFSENYLSENPKRFTTTDQADILKEKGADIMNFLKEFDEALVREEIKDGSVN